MQLLNNFYGISAQDLFVKIVAFEYRQSAYVINILDKNKICSASIQILQQRAVTSRSKNEFLVSISHQLIIIVNRERIG